MPGGGQPGCSVLIIRPEDIYRQWPDLRYFPRPEPPEAHKLEHQVWEKEYLYWRDLRCGMMVGYFCRRHGTWISCSEVNSRMAASQDKETADTCPDNHYELEEFLEEFYERRRQSMQQPLPTASLAQQPTNTEGQYDADGLSHEFQEFSLLHSRTAGGDESWTGYDGYDGGANPGPSVQEEDAATGIITSSVSENFANPVPSSQKYHRRHKHSESTTVQESSHRQRKSSKIEAARLSTKSHSPSYYTTTKSLGTDDKSKHGRSEKYYKSPEAVTKEMKKGKSKGESRHGRYDGDDYKKSHRPVHETEAVASRYDYNSPAPGYSYDQPAVPSYSHDEVHSSSYPYDTLYHLDYGYNQGMDTNFNREGNPDQPNFNEEHAGDYDEYAEEEQR